MVTIHARWANPEPPQALISRITVPVAPVHGERDRSIPPSEARELYQACRGARRLDLVPDMGHAFDPAGLGRDLRRRGVDPERTAGIGAGVSGS